MKFLFEKITNKTNSKYYQIYESVSEIAAVLIMVVCVIFGFIDAAEWITFIGDELWEFGLLTVIIWALIGFITGSILLIILRTSLLTSVNIENSKNELVKMNAVLKNIDLHIRLIGKEDQ